MALVASQLVVSGRVMLTEALPSGCTVMVQLWLLPCAMRWALMISPLLTLKASALPRSVSWSPTERTIVYPVRGYAVSHWSAAGTVDAVHDSVTLACSSAGCESAIAAVRSAGPEGASGMAADVDTDAVLAPWTLLATMEYEYEVPGLTVWSENVVAAPLGAKVCPSSLVITQLVTGVLVSLPVAVVGHLGGVPA